ncbi:MAG: hypothetical protein RLZZ172_2154 [Bacteroidota bacterium]|jgi:hypothetical protein
MINAIISGVLQKLPIESDPALLADLKRALQYRQENRSPEEVRNTYLQDLAVPQIELFDILANKFPIVLKAQEIINSLLCGRVNHHSEITILDIGIGRGLQIEKLLREIDKLPQVEKVTVIGIEIFKPALDFTTQCMISLSKELHFDLNFIPLHSSIEAIDFRLLASKIPYKSTLFMVNASLCLHHVQSKEQRLNLLREINSFQPEIFTLIEPNTDCFTNDFEKRLENAFEHFNALYQYIDTLDLLTEQKMGLKQFFSTEFFDAIALPEAYRFEKYQTGEQWIETGKMAGFQPKDLSKIAAGINISDITCKSEESNYLNFKFKESNILSVIAFES